MDGNIQNNAIAKINLGLDAVLTSPPSQRENVFAGVHRALGLWLATLDGLTPDGADTTGRAEFISKTRIYMRALKTYPADSEEWLEVFWAFRQMFERWMPGPAWRQTSAASRAAGEIERLKQNPFIVFKSEEA